MAPPNTPPMLKAATLMPHQYAACKVKFGQCLPESPGINFVHLLIGECALHVVALLRPLLPRLLLRLIAVAHPRRDDVLGLRSTKNDPSDNILQY